MSTIACPKCREPNAEFNPRCTSCGAALPELSGISETESRPAPAVSSSQDSLLGQSLSHYVVHEKLGAGGMGEVYRATDTLLRRSVALKLLSPKLAGDPQAKARFVREAQAASALDHPNIGTIHEIGEHEGRLFIAMALVEGQTLAERIAAGPLAIEESAGILAQVASGLAAAHAAGIVHRDLKPLNVMLTRSGSVKILDFGLAKLLDETEGSETPLTESGQPLGTVAYMSPEQARGEPLDQRTDLWSLGVMAYEMLTGVRPFDADSKVGTLTRIVSEEPQPLRKLREETPEALQQLVAGLLCKEREKRTQSAAQVLQALGGAPVRRPRSRLALAGAALLLLVGSAVGYQLQLRREPQPPAGAVISARRAVAVLGFKNLSGSSDKAWLSTALSEMLGSELAAGDKLRTIPGENVAHMKLDLSLEEPDSFGKETLGRVRAYLGTDLVVLGSYLALGEKAGGKVRLDLRLQDAVAGETLCSVSVTGTETELFELVTQTGMVLRQKLDIGPRTAEQASWVRTSLPLDPAAARLYVEGLEKLRVWEAVEARQLLEKAIAAEPDFLLAHAALADACRPSPYQMSSEKAKKEARTAYELSAKLPRQERLLVEGSYRLAIQDYSKAIEIYRTLFEFYPDNLEYGLKLARAQGEASLWQDILETVEALRKLPPPVRDDPRIDWHEAVAYLWQSDFAAAERAASKAVASAEALGARMVAAEAMIVEADSLVHHGEPEKAVASAAKAKALFAAAGDREGMARALLMLAHVLFEQGKVSEARQPAEESVEIRRQIGDKILLARGILEALSYQDDPLATLLARHEEVLALFREEGDKPGESDTLSQMAYSLVYHGRIAEARQRCEEALAIERELGRPVERAFFVNHTMIMLIRLGHLEEAAGLIPERAAAARGVKDLAHHRWHIEEAPGVLFMRGELAAARKLLNQTT